MKKIILCSLFALISINVFSQEAEAVNSEPAPQEKSSGSSVFFTMGPQIMYNSDEGSAPNPIYYTLGLGANFLEDKFINLQTRISFSTNYFLWNGKDAKPAEIENRTATVINSMIDLTGMHTWGSNHKIQAGAGLGVFARFGLLSDGVDSDSPGAKENSTAADDVSSINSWFWSDMNFLYPEIAASYTYEFSKWQIGGEMRLYFPLGSLITGDGLDGFMATASVKIIFPK